MNYSQLIAIDDTNNFILQETNGGNNKGSYSFKIPPKF